MRQTSHLDPLWCTALFVQTVQYGSTSIQYRAECPRQLRTVGAALGAAGFSRVNRPTTSTYGVSSLAKTSAFHVFSALGHACVSMRGSVSFSKTAHHVQTIASTMKKGTAQHICRHELHSFWSERYCGSVEQDYVLFVTCRIPRKRCRVLSKTPAATCKLAAFVPCMSSFYRTWKSTTYF